ncbi:MAG TPA: sodium:solute symporter family protein [Gemmatimonadaceae bacterium]|nr:sodium:solute symporter family protein [Gemmatimonadaceae bacterium]
MNLDPVARLATIDYAVMAVYFVAVLGVGWVLRRGTRTSTDFFLSGRSLPPWVTGLAFISANLGAQEVIGMGASGAKYGIATSHFYWIGAIPAMVFVGLFMMPFYYGSKARSVPEYLKLRFDEKTRTLNAVSFAVMTVFSSGISMYAMGKLFNLLLGWSFDMSVLASAAIVLAYVTLGGLTSAIYNEVLQFFLIVFGFAPLVGLGLKSVGGWDGLTAKLNAASVANGLPEGAYTHAWRGLTHASTNPIGVEWFGLVMGLGFVLSFGYWCTDFLVVQRAMAADSMTAARRTPLIAAFPKMFFPFLVILPGMIALAMTAGQGAAGMIPAKMANGAPIVDAAGRTVLDFDLATPMMLVKLFPSGMLGLGLTARLSESATQHALAPGAYTHAWQGMTSASTNPIGVEWFGLVMGLGFVLSFGYWCTDFLVVQRAMAADSMTAARRTPLIAAVPKMLFPFLVILPGMIALALTTGAGHDLIPAKGVDAMGRTVLDYDLATPMMLVRFFPTGMLGLGLTALMASFMSGMAGNVTAFNTVWTYDIYQSHIRKGASDHHYLQMGRIATVAGILLSIAAAYVAGAFNNIMDLLQLVFAFVNAPLFATFALGMFWRRTTGHGAFLGLLSGTVGAAIHHGLTLPAGAHAGVKGGYLGAMHTYPSELAQTFWTAIVAFVTCFVVTIVVSLATRQQRPDSELRGLVYALTDKPTDAALPVLKRPLTLALIVLGLTLVLNLVFR